MEGVIDKQVIATVDSSQITRISAQRTTLRLTAWFALANCTCNWTALSAAVAAIDRFVKHIELLMLLTGQSLYD